MTRVVIAHTPLGSRLLFKKMTGREALSDCYQFDVELLSTDNAIDLQSLLSEPMTLELRPNPFTIRYLSGVITRMEFVGHEKHREEYYVYRATVRPNLWYLTQNKGFRIWQNKTAREIVVAVLAQYNIPYNDTLKGTYRSWEYCVHYQETLYDFIKRLMEHEGIYFYFTHEMNQQTLVLADGPSAHSPFPGYENIEYHQAGAGGYVNEESIDSWQASASISPALYSQNDFNYLHSHADISTTGQISNASAGSTADWIEWPGRYPFQGDGINYTQIRQQEFIARQLQTEGAGDAFGLAPGFIFSLSKAPRADDEGQSFMVTQVGYHLEENSYASNDLDSPVHRFCFSVVPASVNWRPARITPWPRTSGPQTAIVIKASDASKGDGEHISTDEYGRIRVKFLWFKTDEEEKLCSCWLRVASGWAGSQYGAYQIPRVGEEVMVDFINGDPHTPVVIGRVYNDLFTLPVTESLVSESSESEISEGDEIAPQSAAEWNYAKSGIWTRTIGSNDVNDGNYLTFDDTQGAQAVDLHAAKDLNISATDSIKLYSARTGDDSIKIWSPGKVYLQSEDTLITGAPTAKHTVRGSYYTISGANFTTNGIGLTINGVNGTINAVSNFQATTTEFSAKGFVMEYAQVKHTKNHAEFKKSTYELKQLDKAFVLGSLISIMNGGGGALGDTDESKTVAGQLQKLKDKLSLKKTNQRQNRNDTDNNTLDDAANTRLPESRPSSRASNNTLDDAANTRLPESRPSSRASNNTLDDAANTRLPESRPSSRASNNTLDDAANTRLPDSRPATPDGES